MKNLINTFVVLSFLLLFFSCSSDSDDPTPEPDTTAPTVDFSLAGLPDSPGETVVVSNQIEINIDARDSGGIQKVEAFIDDVKVGEDTTAPYQIVVDVSGLSSKNSRTGKFTDYTLKVVVTDTSGNTNSKELTFNVDNELPVISEVSLEAGTAINGDTNAVTFNITDNEILKEVKIYLNNELLSEITDLNFEVNINTLNLQDGANTLKIEAIDLADNTATFEVEFISDNTGPDVLLSTISENDIIFQSIELTPEVEDQFSSVSSLEVVINSNSILLLEDPNNFNFTFNPDEYSAGGGTLELIATDSLGNSKSLSLPINIHRKLLTINIPEDRLSPALIAAVVFASRMDGKLITAKEILREDRLIILSTPEEFDLSTEFMVTFYLEDNGGGIGISTHQNLTRENLQTISLAVPFRNSTEFGQSLQIPITNFLSSDFVIGGSASRFDSHIWSTSESFYSTFLNTTESFLSINTAELETNSNPFDSFYVYNNFSGYQYFLLETPLPQDFVLDKQNYVTDNVDQRSLSVTSGIIPQNSLSILKIFGALSNEDVNANKYHSILARQISSNTINYDLNTLFSNYRHSLLHGNYYTERNGIPLQNYNVPSVTLDYTNSNNLISLNIQGNEHILGRARCFDFENFGYDWYITFNSQSTTEVVIPDFPGLINNAVSAAQQNQNIKVESVELLSYESIIDYNDYLQKVVKNQSNVLEVTDWYQLFYSSRNGSFNIPNREFVFQ
ncbi:Ig-like domain-containing protein [Flagellimonas sp.]|uniref:Ig-like domain-containing protein n=1 Tax=Flagellimonas sp. TaxID=2058762 RepID=UPI003F49F37A